MIEFLTLANKALILVISTLIIWALQRLSLHPQVTRKYPFLESIFFRLGLALMGGSFAADFFSFYDPAPSEIVLNTGIAVLLLSIYVAYKTGRLTRNQNSAI